MANVPNTSRQAYYEHVMSGKATSQKERIMRYFLRIGEPMTRHMVVDQYFHVGHPPRALDGGDPIPWQSATGAIAGMVCRDFQCDHSDCDAYLQVDHEGECPVTGHQSEFLSPIGDRWEQRKMF